MRRKVTISGLITGWTLLASFFSFAESNSLFWKKEFKQQIDGQRDLADQIIDHVLTGPAKGQTYDRLALMTDTFGYRHCGTQTLERSIDYMVDQLKKDGLENVHKEPVQVPHWIRGNEKAALIFPRYKPMSILGLGSSVATPPGGILADAIIVKTFDELKRRAHEAEGKIVVFNQDWEGYGTSVKYRRKGASEAAKVGAVATLIRSVTDFSIYSPHAGQQDYDQGVEKIPTACITVEDADLIWRMVHRGEKIKIFLYMEAQNFPDVISYNTIAEITGSTYPDEVVLVSGHLDSWDVGQGAMDDGAGAFISWQALSIIKQLGLRPKRTIRMALWTCEEPGYFGGKEYFQHHEKDLSNMDFLLESDTGTFTPEGIAFTGSAEAKAIIQHLVETLLHRVNATKVFDGAETPDLNDWPTVGVPTGSLKVDSTNYFRFHHSDGDTMTVEDSHTLDLCSAVWAVTAFTVANMDAMLPANRTLPHGGIL